MHWCAKIQDKMKKFGITEEKKGQSENQLRWGTEGHTHICSMTYCRSCKSIMHVRGKCSTFLWKLFHGVDQFERIEWLPQCDKSNRKSCRLHMEDFTRCIIIGKLENWWSVTSVAVVFGIAHSIVQWAWRGNNKKDKKISNHKNTCLRV